MKLEIFLLLGKVDFGFWVLELFLDLGSIVEKVKFLEEIGYWGLVIEEIKEDFFVVMVLVVQVIYKFSVFIGVVIVFF